MPALLVRLKVNDYATWKSAFDTRHDVRQSNGAISDRVFQNAGDSNEVITLLDWDLLDRARLFVQSDDIHDAMGLARSIDGPEVWFLDESESLGY
jgi:hypothetical protein